MYQVLVLIHQESHRFISDQTADEVLDTVLKDLEEYKFGIPPSKWMNFWTQAIQFRIPPHFGYKLMCTTSIFIGTMYEYLFA